MIEAFSSIFSSHSGSIIDLGELVNCPVCLGSSLSSCLSEEQEDCPSSLLLLGMLSSGGRLRKFGRLGGRIRFKGPPRGFPMELRAPIEPNGPARGPRAPPMDLGGSGMLPGGRTADGAPIVRGGMGCPVLPASFAICCNIFWTFPGEVQVNKLRVSSICELSGSICYRTPCSRTRRTRQR